MTHTMACPICHDGDIEVEAFNDDGTTNIVKVGRCSSGEMTCAAPFTEAQMKEIEANVVDDWDREIRDRIDYERYG